MEPEITIQSLLDNIKKEGFREAEKISQKIIAEAEAKAAMIIREAEKKAKHSITNAQEEVRKIQDKTRSIEILVSEKHARDLWICSTIPFRVSSKRVLSSNP
jgi:cell division septum initiation protein DivIVA